MVVKSGKIWGNTELIEKNGVLEFHRIEYRANTQCSEHYHATKWNGFFVESGVMEIRTWEEDGVVDVTSLHAGEYFKVAPGKWHQFVGVQDGVAFELYWAEFNHDDIVRRTQGQDFSK
jgi:mannose-6-phosphate isomerase-like protein (cupin superfamily)